MKVDRVLANHGQLQTQGESIFQEAHRQPLNLSSGLLTQWLSWKLRDVEDYVPEICAHETLSRSLDSYSRSPTNKQDSCVGDLMAQAHTFLFHLSLGINLLRHEGNSRGEDNMKLSFLGRWLNHR